MGAVMGRQAIEARSVIFIDSGGGAHDEIPHDFLCVIQLKQFTTMEHQLKQQLQHITLARERNT